MSCLRNQRGNKAGGNFDVRYASACRGNATNLRFMGHSDGHHLELRLMHFKDAAQVEWIFFLDQ